MFFFYLGKGSALADCLPIPVPSVFSSQKSVFAWSPLSLPQTPFSRLLRSTICSLGHPNPMRTLRFTNGEPERSKKRSWGERGGRRRSCKLRMNISDLKEFRERSKLIITPLWGGMKKIMSSENKLLQTGSLFCLSYRYFLSRVLFSDIFNQTSDLQWKVSTEESYFRSIGTFYQMLKSFQGMLFGWN